MTEANKETLIAKFNELQREVDIWSRQNFGDQMAWKPLLGIGEEVGELNHAYLKMLQGIRGTPSEHTAAIKDAVGDLLIYTADFCSKLGISMGEALTKTWSQVSQRDWVKFPENGGETK